MAGLAAKLEVRQGQGLVVTPQLQQAIKLLQLSNLELEAFVEAEMERNPLLERDDRDAALDAAEPAADSAPETGSDELSLSESPGQASEAELDANYDDLYADNSRADRDADEGPQPGLSDWSGAGGSGGFESLPDDYEGRVSTDVSLGDHLRDQLGLASLSPADQLIALSLIDGVDEGGYLRGELAEIADRLGCDVEAVERVLFRLQGFEPTGVFARSVPECLRLQLRELDRCDPAMDALLENLDLLARRDMAGLRRVCGVDDEDLRDMIGELRALTPRPGAAYGGGEPVQPVVPDVFVREGAHGAWNVELNGDTLPKLLVNQRYHARVAGAAKRAEDKAFVAECLNNANWLMRSLDQRARTILKVASEIVRQQDAFLVFGVEHLKPLNLKHVADAIGMHESTVSRVTSNKYVSTPRGVFELKFFFTTALAATDGGAAVSAETVRRRIKTLIESEAAETDVLSDDRIVEILKEAGVDIARRTVAKYREAMRIPSSVERKRLLKHAH